MSQEDYREKIEEHRQAVNFESEQETNPSRMTRRQIHGNHNKKKKTQTNRLITTLAIIFILIPVSTLIYFAFLANGSKNEKTVIDHNEVQIETNTEHQSQSTTKASNNEESKLTEKEKVAKKLAEKKALEEQAAKEKAQKEASIAKQKEEAAKKEKQQKIYNEAKAAGRLYNVKPGETIESISMKFYGSDVGIAIIKEANGITGDSVPAGTTIAIPAQ